MSSMRILVATLCFLVPVTPTLADIVVLRTGESYVGLLANRESIRVPFDQTSTIGLLHKENSNSEEVLLRFHVKEIDYIVLEDSLGRRVIDCSHLVLPPQSSSVFPQGGRISRSHAPGIGELVLGLFTFGIGVAIKFGEEKATITENSIDYDEKSYNALNYALMASGGALMLLGAVSLAGSSSSGTQYGYQSHPRDSDPGEFGLRLSVGIEF